MTKADHFMIKAYYDRMKQHYSYRTPFIDKCTLHQYKNHKITPQNHKSTSHNDKSPTCNENSTSHNDKST